MFAKLQKATSSFVMSVCLSVHPRGTTQLQMKGFLWNLVFKHFYKTCWKYSSFIKIWQDYWVLYVKT